MNLHSKFYLKRADARNTGHRRLCRRVPHPRTQFAASNTRFACIIAPTRQAVRTAEPSAGAHVHANPKIPQGFLHPENPSRRGARKMERLRRDKKVRTCA